MIRTFTVGMGNFKVLGRFETAQIDYNRLKKLFCYLTKVKVLPIDLGLHNRYFRVCQVHFHLLFLVASTWAVQVKNLKVGVWEKELCAQKFNAMDFSLTHFV